MNKRQYKLTTHELTYISLAVTLITVCAWIAIPFGDIPVTLQTFAIFVVTSLLGIRQSLLALLVYLLMGLVGLPVFSGMTGGLGRIIGPTGGYLIGFVFIILIEGTITHRLGKRLLIFSSKIEKGLTYPMGDKIIIHLQKPGKS